MANCCQCDGIESRFDRKTAERELRRFRRKGPIRSTRLLIEMLRPYAADGSSTLLDVGGGIGAIHHALLDEGVARAMHVDVSPAYLRAAEEELTARGHAGRVQLVRGDLVSVASEIPAADLVTLDRVICCYPDMEALLDVTAAKTRVALGAVYPRDKWWMRLGIATVNKISRLRGSAFRVFAYSPDDIHARLRRHGLARVDLKRAREWEIAIYVRR